MMKNENDELQREIQEIIKQIEKVNEDREREKSKYSNQIK